MNELTPLQGAELAVRQAEQQGDYLALALQTAQIQAASMAVQANALAQVATQVPAKQGGLSAGRVIGGVVGVVMVGGIVVAVVLSVAIAAPAVCVSLLVLRKMWQELGSKEGKS